MQEYWFCEACKSMNRANSRSCYRCRAPRDAATMGTVIQRQPGTVLSPSLDEHDRAAALELMRYHGYFSAWRIGYVAASLLALAGAILLALSADLFALMPFIVQNRTLPADDPRTTWLTILVFAFSVAALFGIVIHSVFLGLSSANTRALGAGTPRFYPLRAALWWVESSLWAIRASLGFIVPVLVVYLATLIGVLFLGILGAIIFGLFLGIVWVVLTYMLLGNPITSLGKPKRLLADLYDRLAVPGSRDGRVVSWWAMSWGVSRSIVDAVAALIYLVVLAVVLIALVGFFVGFQLDFAPAEQSNDAYTALVIFVTGAQIIAELVAWVLLIVITWEIADRQRIRENWVQSGVRPSGSPVSPTPVPDQITGLVGQQAVVPGRPTYNVSYDSDDYLPPAAAPARLSAPQYPAPRYPAEPESPDSPDSPPSSEPPRLPPMPRPGIPRYPIPDRDGGEEPPRPGWS